MNRYRFFVPNLCTSLSLLSALISLNYIAKEEFLLACWFIFASMIFDFLDGKIARRLNAMSKFGALYDTMSDFVAFGVAPGLLIYRTTLLRLNPYGALIAAIYIFAGCYRLIRFSLRDDDKKRKVSFIGLPIPMAAGFLSVIMIIYITLWKELPNEYFMAVTTILISYLMVSRIEYLTVKEGGKISKLMIFIKIIILISIIVSIFYNYSHIVFLILITGYILYNPLRHIMILIINKNKGNSL